MAQLGQTFDATTVNPNSDFEPLPVGDYVMQIITSEIKPTKDGFGQYLELEMEVLDGDYHGRKFWDRLNLWNPNAKAVEIANRTLSSICHAVNEMSVEDSEQLHFKPMLVKMKVKADKNGNPQNNATYAALDSAGAPPAQAPAPAAQQAPAPRPAAPAPSRPAAPQAGAARPWERKAAA